MKSSLQKRKLILLYRFFKAESSPEHPVKMAGILAYLHENGVECERKSIYDDIAALCDAGVTIEKTPDRRGYYLDDRDFELAELKLLVDAVSSAKFLSVGKSGELIKKIESLTDRESAKGLQHQVYVLNRAKTANESVYYNVDIIHGAIADDKKITFRYFNYNNKKERVFGHDGGNYSVSPLGLTWDNENYYLVAKDEQSGSIKHYRVDKMISISVSDEKRSAGGENFDIAAYSKKSFNMFGGEEISVTLRCDGSLAGVIIDRFGIDVMMAPTKDGGFTVRLKVMKSPIFYSWVFGFGTKMKIMTPSDVAEDFAAYAAKVMENYGEDEEQ